MRFNLLTTITLLPSTLAAPLSTKFDGATYSWSVTNWSAGCVHSGCFYDFNITGNAFSANPTNPTIPAFSAYCSGFGVGAPYTACNIYDDFPANRGVVAKLLPAEEGTGAHIQVSLQWTDLVQESTYYNYTGNATASYNQFVAPVSSFTITPSEAYGVA